MRKTISNWIVCINICTKLDSKNQRSLIHRLVFTLTSFSRHRILLSSLDQSRQFWSPFLHWATCCQVWDRDGWCHDYGCIWCLRRAVPWNNAPQALSWSFCVWACTPMTGITKMINWNTMYNESIPVNYGSILIITTPVINTYCLHLNTSTFLSWGGGGQLRKEYFIESSCLFRKR